jgi:hypothetical protein
MVKAARGRNEAEFRLRKEPEQAVPGKSKRAKCKKLPEPA